MNLRKAEQAHQSGDISAARRYYELALHENADNAGALYGLGTIALQERQFDKAELLLSKASQLEPTAADIALNLAVAMNRNGNKKGAINEAIRAAELAQGDMAFSNRIAQLLLKLNQANAVLELNSRLHQASTNGPKSVRIESQIIVARAYGLLGEWDRSVSMLKAMAQEHQRAPGICRELSIAAARLRDFPLAVESYQYYLQQVDATAQDNVRLADLYHMARDKKGMAEALARAQSLGAADAEYHVLCARLARLDDRAKDALTHCRQAIEQSNDHGAAWALLMDVSSNSDIERQLPTLERAIQSSSSSENNLASLYFAFANAYQSLGQYTLAFRQYRKANQFHQKDLRSRGIEYDTSRSEKQVANTIKHFTASCIGGNNVIGPIAPIFIVGMPRSGTTLMEKILAQLPGVTAGGEIESLSFVSTQYQIDVNNRTKPLPTDMSAVQWQQVAEQYYGRAPVVSGALTDKLPHNFNNVGLALALFPNVRVLQMRRDPRDVCLSIYAHQFPDGHSYACDFDSLAHAYSLSQRLMDHWAQLAPLQVKDINYEDLVRSPETVGKAAVEFCGFDWSDKCLDFHEKTSASFTFSEQQVREGIHKTRIERWRMYENQLEELQAALQKYKVLTDPTT